MAPFEGVENFRDFGGCRTQDQRMVAAGRLYRCAHLCAVTATDVARLDALGVAFLVDFRGPDERAAMPDKWAPARTLFRDPDAARRPTATLAGPRTPYTAETARTMMRQMYSRMVQDRRFIALLGDLFRSLATAGGPLIVHCASGKDRTGIACALLLHALGVDQPVIYADYLATNAQLDWVERAEIIRGDLEPVEGPLDDATIAPLIGVEAQYLQAAFQTIATRQGSVEAYLQDTLGVTPLMQAQLRAHLLV